MSGLDALFARDGLAAELRALVLIEARAALGDREGLDAAIDRTRQLGVPRADVEETLLQGVLFFGFPRAVSAFTALERRWPPTSAPRGGGLPREQWQAAGRALFDAIYGRNASDVHAMLRGFHEEFHDFVLESAYGRVLTRPGLDPRSRELIAVGALAVLDQVPQLVAHARGARAFGASDDELREVLVSVVDDERLVAEHLRRIG